MSSAGAWDAMIAAELAQRPWLAAPAHSIWRITGTYDNTGGTFTDCLAIVLDSSVTGTFDVVFSMLPPLAWGGGGERVILTEQITTACLVVADPWVDQRATLAYVDKSIDNVDSLGPDVPWTNTEVVALLNDIRSLLLTGDVTPGTFHRGG